MIGSYRCDGIWISVNEVQTANCEAKLQIMGESETYRKFAEECTRIARNALPHQKAILLEMAELWTSLAEKAEAKNGCASNSN